MPKVQRDQAVATHVVGSRKLADFLSNSRSLASKIPNEATEGIRIMSRWQIESKGKTPLPSGTSVE